MAPKAKPSTTANSNGSAKAPNGKAAVVEKTDTLDPSSTSKPDKKVYDAEQERIKNEIDALQAKLVCLVHSCRGSILIA